VLAFYGYDSHEPKPKPPRPTPALGAPLSLQSEQALRVNLLPGAGAQMGIVIQFLAEFDN